MACTPSDCWMMQPTTANIEKGHLSASIYNVDPLFSTAFMWLDIVNELSRMDE